MAKFGKHVGHGKHLCQLTAERKMDEVAKASKGAAYVCQVCGRASSAEEHLCEPVKI